MGPKKKASEGKKHRKILSIEQKKEIIAKHLEGVKVMQLARIYETSHSTISTILAMKEELMVAKVAKGTSRLNVRGVLFEEMENLLLIWIKKREMVGDTISQSAICQKAKQIYQDLKNKTPGSSSEVNDDFKASRGWFDNFKKRTGIHSVVRYREADSADKAAAKKFVNSFARIIGGEYLSQQVFNCNETGLFWKKMPNRTFITKEVEEDDDEELSEMHDQELITDDLKELYKQQCEEKEVEISSEDEDGEKEQITTDEIKNVLAKWEEVQNFAMKWNPNKSEVIRTADLFNEKSMQFFRNILKKRQKQTTLDMFFKGSFVKKLQSEPNCPSGKD